MFFDQSSYDVRCEWGAEGASHLSSTVDTVIVVDILSFTTCIQIATSRDAIVYPYKTYGDAASQFASSIDAQLASSRRGDGLSLSPASLLEIATGTRLVLPSPNGATVTLTTGCRWTLAGCLRNARAVAEAATKLGRTFLVIPAGERWEGGSMRPCLEDLIGAGSIIARLPGTKSPEAKAAQAAFETSLPTLEETLRLCSSGRELIERGFERDVELAAELDCSDAVPYLRDGAYEKLAL